MEQRLKERLIGTAVITALAVIFLPMLIDDDDQRWTQQESVVDVPPLPDKFKNKPQILSDTGVDDAHLFSTSKKPPRSEISSITKSNTGTTNSDAEIKTASAPVINKPVLKTSPIKKAPPGIEKQLESLLPPANQNNKQLASRQVATAQPTKTIQQPTPKIVKKPLPKVTPPIVKQAVPVVAKVQKLPSSVTSQQQSTSKPASKPQKSQKVLNSDLTGLWIVQAGVFKEKANADALRTKLSKNGFSAYLESVTTELGELIRVRAGRVPEEKAARQMVMALNKRFALKSITFPETKWNSKRARQ